MRLALVLADHRAAALTAAATAVYRDATTATWALPAGGSVSVTGPRPAEPDVLVDGSLDAAAHRLLRRGPAPRDVPAVVDGTEGAAVVVASDGRSALLVRDQLGTRPLHHGVLPGGGVAIASEIKQLVAMGVERIAVVPPASVVVLGGDEPQTWRDELVRADTDETFEDRAAALGREVRASVAARAGRPVAVAVSGGVDSSTVLAVARESGADVVAVTVALPGSPDLEFSTRLCADLGVPLTVIEPEPIDDADALLRELVADVESWEQQVLTHAVPSRVLMRHVATTGRALLTGEASDELFGGYRSAADDAAEVAARRDKELGNFHRTSAQRLDRLGQRFGVDVRLPFAARRVVEAARRFRPEEMVHGELTKWPLRVAMRGTLPEYILERPKLTFARGVGYRYGQHADGDGLFAGQVRGPRAGTADERLTVGDAEAASLERFLELGYGRADYMLTRTL
ncbi:hypothetical protein Cch01nite_13370 [Cellulomonas chitinilytica]|uniref:Asparagine synthetase domain-containing protein n=1 Tax=Cellulomonas chitinilytica TaxID=398759 RepID=A0A919NZN5_9CELL|nr:asparagine synthase C-terminal domain-containing protein [Cellulomonas chitinilytica]GIG20613.1 hypothetical protein Cch01nite_13370 [Cellulomonas chitinilytica]